MTPVLTATIECVRSGHDLEKALINAAKVLQFCRCGSHREAEKQASAATDAVLRWRKAYKQLEVAAEEHEVNQPAR